MQKSLKLCKECGTECIFNGSQEQCLNCLTIYVHSDEEIIAEAGKRGYNEQSFCQIYE